MELRKVHQYMNVSKQITICLTIIAFIFYFLKIRTCFYIAIGFLVLSIALYALMALVFWRCPHCHQYLPLKGTKGLKRCPHCNEKLYDK